MSEDTELVALDEAVHQVELAITRIALLHLSFAKTLIDEFGEKKGTDLVIKSIMEYGKRIAERVSKGGDDLPKWGVYSGDVYQDSGGRYVLQGCNFANIFKEYEELSLGRLYCYVDAAKSMSSDPRKKLIHATCEACGDDRCTFEEVPTTEVERRHFMKRGSGMKLLDPRLAQGT